MRYVSMTARGADTSFSACVVNSSISSVIPFRKAREIRECRSPPSFAAETAIPTVEETTPVPQAVAPVEAVASIESIAPVTNVVTVPGAASLETMDVASAQQPTPVSYEVPTVPQPVAQPTYIDPAQVATYTGGVTNPVPEMTVPQPTPVASPNLAMQVVQPEYAHQPAVQPVAPVQPVEPISTSEAYVQAISAPAIPQSPATDANNYYVATPLADVVTPISNG